MKNPMEMTGLEFLQAMVRGGSGNLNNTYK